MKIGWRDQFRLKHFGFTDCDPARFYQSQWSENRWIFWIIKLLLLAYWLGWFIAGFIVPDNITKWWIFLTNWGVTVILLYFLCSFALATYGVIERKEDIARVKPAILANTVSGAIIVMDDQTIIVSPKQELRCFHIIVWILHEVSFAWALFITIAYWALLDANTGPFSINRHAINLVIMIIDLFLCDIPFRFWHFYHGSFGAAVYTVFSLILHGAGYTSAIYSVLNWASRIGFTIGLVLLTILVFIPITHLIGFGFYHLRWYIARSCLENKERSNKPDNAIASSGEVNNAFTA